MILSQNTLNVMSQGSVNFNILMLCLSPSKFNIVPMVMDTWMVAVMVKGMALECVNRPSAVDAGFPRRRVTNSKGGH